MRTDLKLERRWFSETATVGELYVDGQFFCYTLEDRLREPGAKVPGETCIPIGCYEIVLSYSGRFQKLLPLLVNVPNFQGIRIHAGNRPENTEGCILVGKGMDRDIITDSRAAFSVLFDRLKSCVEKGEVFITVFNAPVEDTRAGQLEAA